jgi:hypothetical protein
MAEAMAAEVEERKTKDDDYDLEFMFDNSPVEDGMLVATDKDIKKTKEGVSDTGFEALNTYEKAQQRKFPLRIIRDKEVANKLEQLSHYVHVKKISSEHRIIEFFVPAKYKTFDADEKSDIFAEIIDVDQVWLTDEYGGRYGYTVTGFRKRILQTIEITKDGETHDEPIYEVIKLNANKIQNIE